MALVNAKANGDSAAQARAETLKAWLDAHLQQVQSAVTAKRTAIQSFVDQYAGSTSDIEQVRKAFQEVKERGPVLQDVYETDKRAAVAQTMDYNLAPIYIKSVLVVGLAVVAGLVWRRI